MERGSSFYSTSKEAARFSGYISAPVGSVQSSPPPYSTLAVSSTYSPQLNAPANTVRGVVCFTQTRLTKPPRDYLFLSIFTAIFCCLCFGIAAIYKSTKVREATRQGDIKAAAEASRHAKTLNIIGVILGFIIVLLFFILDAVYIS